MQANDQKGFSLIELMVVVATIGILAMLSIPSIRFAAGRAQATTTANDIRVFFDAVEIFTTQNGSYPEAMTYTNIPSEIADYLPAAWKDGNYNWFYVNSDNYIYIYIYNLNFTAEQAIQLDRMIDDGNIATGELRMAYQNSGLIYLFRYTEGEIDPSRDQS
jgi:prepilin-type N-terminal cleavage/methylation domain-containing protein